MSELCELAIESEDDDGANNNTTFLTITNPNVIAFYKSHPNINFEQSQILLIDMLSKSSSVVNKCYSPKMYSFNRSNSFNLNTNTNTTNLNTNFADVTHSHSHSYSNIQQNIYLEHILNNVNPMSKIIKNTDTTICGEYIISSSSPNDNNNNNIIIENKIDQENLNSIVVDAFKKSCQEHNSNGILMSQHSGIIGKNDFEIDIIGNNVIIYLHKVHLDEYKIKLAVNIATKLSNLLVTLNTNNIIVDDTLNKIKAEYQQFSESKLELQTFIKNANSTIVHKLETMKLCNIGEYLSTKFTQVDKPKLYTCNMCEWYTSNTLKGLAAHKRGCKKKCANANINATMNTNNME